MAYLEALLILVLILLNGVLAMSELAVASSRMNRLKLLAERQVRGARRAMALASDPGRFLSTVQIGITLIGILAGAFSGAAFGERMTGLLLSFGMRESVAEPIGFGLVIGIITYLSLIIGELVPKQLALRNPEGIACLVAPAMTLLAKLASPLVWLLERSGRLVLMLLGQARVAESRVTDAEIHAVIAEAESAGVLEPEERSMIAGVLRLGDRPVRAVMTPRSDVEMIDVDDPPAKIGKLIAESGHSRFIAYEGDPENIIGVIQAKDIAAQWMSKRAPRIRPLVKQAPIIPDSLDALEAVERLKESNVHFGLVFDEYGQFEGVVTSADILEAIVGVFRDDNSPTEPDVVEREDGSLLFAGSAAIHLLTDRLGLSFPPNPGFDTIAGFILDRLARIPATGETFTERGWKFEVVDLDGRRVDKVLVSRSVEMHRAAQSHPSA